MSAKRNASASKLLLLRWVMYGGVILFLMAGLEGAYLSKQAALAQQSASPVLQSQVFKGTLPCADCSGLATQLTLSPDASNSSQGKFSMSEEYLGKGMPPMMTQGDWKIVHGMPGDKTALIYQLSTKNPQGTQYYLQVNDMTLLGLDQNKQKIDSPFDMTLKKVPSNSQP